MSSLAMNSHTELEQLKRDLDESQKRVQYLEQTLEGFEKRMEDLEQSLGMKGRILDTICDQCTKFEEFQSRTEPCINILCQDVGKIERNCARTNETIETVTKKFEDKYFIADSNIDTLFRASVDRSKEYKGLAEKMKKSIKDLDECKRDIIGLDGTMLNYKQENKMLENRVSDIHAENQSRDNSVDVLRLKLIDVLDEVEKTTKEHEDIKHLASQTYFQNKKYDKLFEVLMTRMDSHEDAMKSVTVFWKDMRSLTERIELLERK